MLISRKRRLDLTQRILFPERRPAGREGLARYFGPYRLPGTAPIGLRKTAPEIFQDTLASVFETYEDWLDRTLAKTLHTMRSGQRDADPRRRDAAADCLVIRMAKEILEFETADGISLNMAVPQQMYEDVFTRLISLVPDWAVNVLDAHPYARFNALCHRIGLVLLDLMEKTGVLSDTADISRLIHLAVLSGYVGINLKSSASAASDLLNRNLMPIDPNWVKSMASVRSVSREDLSAAAQKMLDVAAGAEGRFAIESLDRYYQEVVETDVPTLLVFFCDDYLESMIDMKRFEAVMGRNACLKLLFVPRNGRYGNDLAFPDLPAILAEKHFGAFRALHGEGRIVISRNGPCAGCIDPRNMSAALIDEMDAMGKDRRIIFETKGCRNFEMLQGLLPVPWYASFNCNRAISIRTVGVDGPPVFLRIAPGLKAYDGFNSPRIGRSPSYGTAGVRFARMTTRQLYDSLSGEVYRRMLCRSNDEYGLNQRLMATCEADHLTLPEALAELSDQMALAARTARGAGAGAKRLSFGV